MGDTLSAKPDRNSQSMQALLRLRELIINGEFPPGSRMSELPLVERLGVSRTPLRLALANLEHEGLLEPLPAGGYAVREFTQRDIDEAIELRGVLEGTAVRFAAQRGVSRRELNAMNALIDEIEPVVHKADYESFERYVGLNDQLHSLFLSAAQSPVIERALEQAMALPFAAPGAMVLAQAELPESREILVIAQSHHRAILEALEHRDGTRAEGVAREHARIARRNLEIAVANRDALDRIPGASLIRLAGGDGEDDEQEDLKASKAEEAPT
jgi:GntR family transcriptional regulator, vanillate catabolism transcriptional regulator